MHIVLYDDECPLCQFQMKVLSWLDWRNTLAIVPLSDPRAKAFAPSLTREDLLEAIHCVTPEGRIYRGARAIRFVGMRLPLLVPLALLLIFIPGGWVGSLVAVLVFAVITWSLCRPRSREWFTEP